MALDEIKWGVDQTKKFGEGFLPQNMRKFPQKASRLLLPFRSRQRQNQIP